MFLLFLSFWCPVLAASPSNPLEQALLTASILDNEEVWRDMVALGFGPRSARLGLQHRNERRDEKHVVYSTAAVQNTGRNLLTTSCGSYDCAADDAVCCYARETCCDANTTCCDGKCCRASYFCAGSGRCCSNEYSVYNGALVRHNSTHCGVCAPMGAGCCDDNQICGGWGTVNGTEVFRTYTQCCPSSDGWCVEPGDTCCDHRKAGYLGSLHSCNGINGEQICCQGHYGGLGYYYGLDCCDSHKETCCGGFCCPKPQQCCPDRRLIRLNETWYGKLNCQVNVDVVIGILVNSMSGAGGLDLVGEIAMFCSNCTESFNCNGSAVWEARLNPETRQATVTSIVWETSPPPPPQCFSPYVLNFEQDHGELVPAAFAPDVCRTALFAYRKPVCCEEGTICCGGWCCPSNTPVCCGEGECCLVMLPAGGFSIMLIIGVILAALTLLALCFCCVGVYRAPNVERKQRVTVRRLKQRHTPAPKNDMYTPFIAGPAVIGPPADAPPPPYGFEEMPSPHGGVEPAPSSTKPNGPKRTKMVKKLVPVEVEVKKFQTAPMQYLGNIKAQGRGEDGLTKTVTWGEAGAVPSALKKDGAEEVVETKMEMREVEVEEEDYEPVFVSLPIQPSAPPLPPASGYQPGVEEYEEVEEEVPVFVRELRLPCLPCFSVDIPTSRAECCRILSGTSSSEGSWCCCCMCQRNGGQRAGNREYLLGHIQ